MKLYPYSFKHLKNMHKVLLHRYEGPFPIRKRIGKVAYKVEVSPHLEIHMVFHVSQLKAVNKDKEDERRAESHRAPTLVTKTHDHEVKEIIAVLGQVAQRARELSNLEERAHPLKEK
ncbi:unnamed protein product [Linum trigynum]|uniref:Tf2-1-like SH3-like domain-containing protein n=1 Tax=Linum trigynum TaxID=586398 RepID=A0AAV2E6S2_9ROSI